MADDLHKFPDIFVSTAMTPHRVNLSPDFWVDIKPAMSVAEYERYESALVTIQAEREAGIDRRNQGSQGVTMNAGKLDLLVLNIVDWAADAQITKATVGKLAHRHMVKILDEIEMVNKNIPFTQDLPTVSDPILRSGISSDQSQE